MRCRFVGLVVFLVLVSTVTSFQAAELPEGFRLEPVLDGLTEPSSMAAAPDGRIFIAERTTGNLRVVRGGVLQPAAVCSVGVNATGQAGLLGVAVHPAFDRNGWVYLYYTSSATNKNRVSRFTVGPDSCTDETTILSDLGAGPGFIRNGGGVAFGPDGKLYVATGDIQSAANGQNGSVLQGKILRLNDDGSTPADNPTPGSLIFASGVRDGSDVSVNPSGQVYMVDRGDNAESAHDELGLVPVGGNLGWASVTGSDGPGGFDDPLVEWLPTVGLRGLSVYTAQAFPDLAADGLDNDGDRFGADGEPGVRRVDDDGNGVCVSAANGDQPCTSTADCPATGSEITFCEFRDEPDEWCPGGTPYGDDGCIGAGAIGEDEPDESFVNNLFVGAGDKIQRAVPMGAGLDQLSSWSDFLDSTALPGCPTGWTDVMAGNDGLLYALALNGGGSGGALYRVVYDETAGAREVSAPGSHFPMQIDKGATPADLVIRWEDLRDDAKQPRNSGTTLQAPVREYTLWKGDLGTFTSHAVIAGFDGIEGAPVNDALRETTVTLDPAQDEYFLVSARHDNLQGPLGEGNPGPRAGFVDSEICTQYGLFKAPGWELFKCGTDFTLQSGSGESFTLSDLRGKVVVMDFAARWCGPCVWEADRVEGIYQDFKDRGVELLTVLMDEDFQFIDWAGRPTQAECRNWGDRSGATPDHTFECVVDPSPAQQAWPRYQVNGSLPRTVVLDQGMRVVYTLAGWNSPPGTSAEDALRAKLDELVGTADQCLH